MSSSTSICRNIVSVGIITLTTACTVLKKYGENKNLQLTIISEKFSPETTADVSTGFLAKAAHVSLLKMPFYALRVYNSQNKNDDKIFEKPSYSILARHFRTLDKHEISMFDHLKPVVGFSMSSITIEISRYLSQLQCYLLQDSRVKFIKRKIYSLIELKDKADIVVNCTEIIQVHAAWKKSVYEFDTEDGFGYIIPYSNSVVLGETFQLNNWNTIIDENDTKNVLCICSKCLPALEHIRHGKVQVGLRLYRDDGITISWGCAKDVVDIVKTLLPPAPKEQNSENDNLPEHEQLWRLTLNFEYVVIRAKI
ncbi:unnamed protein product [Rotaria sp. Silwood1]|nr:unnamed protein product [Rotaria sp. Silwood1]